MFHNVLSISPFSGHETPQCSPVLSPRPGPKTFSSPGPGQQPGQLQAVTLALPAVVWQLALYMIIASQTVFTLGKIKMPRNKMVHYTTGSGPSVQQWVGCILIEITDYVRTALGQQLISVSGKVWCDGGLFMAAPALQPFIVHQQRHNGSTTAAAAQECSRLATHYL